MFAKILIACCLVSVSLLGFIPQRIEAEPLHIAETIVTEPSQPQTLEKHLKDIFGDKDRIALAVFKHESGLKLDAKNYNCRYNGKSTFCKTDDRINAVSVDCGIAQINVKGKVCPVELMTLEGNMKAVKDKYSTQGFNAWISYRTGAYLKYL